jgi:hypothetical protein
MSEDSDHEDLIDYKWLAKEIYDWFSEPEHYSVVHFAVEHNMSKEELFRVCAEDRECQRMLDYAMSVQEYKVVEGAINGALDRNVVLKMLETYSGWKGDVNILQKNEYRQYMNEAERKARAILGEVGGRLSDIGGESGFIVGESGSIGEESDSIGEGTGA